MRFHNRTFAGLASFGYESCLAKKIRNQCETYAKSSRNTLTDFVFCGTLAEKALLQIDEKRYDSDMTALGVEKIIKIGIAFSGKKAVVKRTK